MPSTATESSNPAPRAPSPAHGERVAPAQRRSRLRWRIAAAVLGAAVLAALVAWLAGGDDDDRPPHEDAPVVARLRMVAASEPATPESIAPYDESLALCEYEVLEIIEGEVPDRDRVRVAHWGVLASEPVAVPAVGSRTSYSQSARLSS